MIDPKAYTALVDAIDALMARATLLGLHRTAERLHEALREARSELHEAMPQNVPTLQWRIGPIREQL